MSQIKNRIDVVCEKIIEYSFYAMVFFIPSSKSVVEVCATLAILAWLVKKARNLKLSGIRLNTSPALLTVTVISFVLLVPLFIVMISTISSRHMEVSLKTPLPLFSAIIVSLIALAFFFIVFISVYNSQHVSRKIKIPFLLLIDISIITSLFTTQYISISMGSLFFKTMEYLALFFIIAETINTRKKVMNMLITIFVSAFITGIDGIYQQITGFDFFRKFPLFVFKVSATFKFPNDFGTYLATVLPLPIAFIASKAMNKRSKFILIGFCLILLIDLALTQSRGAWLGFVIGALFVCLISGRKKFVVAVALLIILGIILSFFAPGEIKQQMKSFLNLGTDASTNDRVIIWKTGWKMFIDKPVFGHGLNTFMRVFSDFKPKDYTWIVYAHNCFLQMAAEIGIIGLLAFLWLAFVILREAMLKFLASKEDFLKAVSVGLIGGLLAYLVNSFFDTNLYSLPLAVLFWSVAGLAAARFQTE